MIGAVAGEMAFAEIGTQAGMKLGLPGAFIGCGAGLLVGAAYNAYYRQTEKSIKDDDVVGN